jgi:hypothetical protein
MPNPFSGNAALAESVEGRPVYGREIAVGKQVVRFEPEIVYFRLRGTYEAHEVRGLTSLIDQVTEERGAGYILVDMRDLRWLTSEARRECSEWVRRSPIGALAVFGTNQHIRVIISLLLRAASLLGRTPYPMRFLDTEEEARAWLAAERGAAK